MNKTYHTDGSSRIFFLLISIGFILKLICSNDYVPEFLIYSGDIIFILSIVYSLIFGGKRTFNRDLIVFVFLSVFLFSIASFWTDSSIVGSLKSSLRFFLPILVANQLILYRKSNNYTHRIRRTGFLVFILLHSLLIVGFLFLPASHNRGEVWAPAYFQGLHSTAYVVLSSYFIFQALLSRTARYRLQWEVLYILFTFYYISELFGVRTALVSLVAFILLRCTYMLKSKHLIASIVVLCTGTFLFFLVYADPIGDGLTLYTSLSSGRLAMYSQKIEQLRHNSIISWFIGNGFNSDLITSKIWWWEAKGAHNDFITILVERGVMGMILFFMIMRNLYIALTVGAKDSILIKMMLVSLFISSAFSNGIIVRPVAAYVFFLALVLVSTRGDDIARFVSVHRQE